VTFEISVSSFWPDESNAILIIKVIIVLFFREHFTHILEIELVI
jgi:hypothetical protein